MTVAGLESVFVDVAVASRDAGILALAIGGLLLFTGRKIAPVWRHFLWMLVAVRLMLPVLPESPSSWQSWVPEKVTPVVGIPTEVVVPDLPQLENLPVISEKKFQPVTTNALPEPSPSRTPRSWQSILAMVWLSGVAGFLTLLSFCTIRFRRKLRRLDLPNHEKLKELRELLAGICREIGIRRSPGLRITDAVASPALTGLMRPEILIPPSAINQLGMPDLRLVLLHELGHQKRCDVWTSWLLSLLHVVHWFNPLVWWAFHKTRQESERATDAWVLQKTGADRAADYGEALLRLLEGSAKPKMPLPDIVGVLESPRDLRARIIAIGRFTGKRSRWAVALSVSLICGLVAVGFTQAPKDKAEKDSVVEKIVESKNDKSDDPAAEEKPGKEDVKKTVSQRRNIYHRIQTSKPLIALTFDDGPVKANTTRLLNMLKERNAKATFFVVGEMVKNQPQLLRRMVEEGHEIGNHTMKHPAISRLSDKKVLEELKQAHAVIKEVAGVDVKIFRPPGGAITKWQKELIMQELGYATILWSVDPADWKKPGVAVVTQRLVDGAVPGAILFAHDLQSQTVDAMPAVLDQLLEKGFKFVTVSELIAADETPEGEIAKEEPSKPVVKEGKTIDFIVKDSDGNLVPAADVEIAVQFQPSYVASPIAYKGKTNEKGAFRIKLKSRLSEKGFFIVSAFSQKYGKGKGATQYSKFPSKPIEITLSKGKSLKLRVTDNEGNPIRGLRMRAKALQTKNFGYSPRNIEGIPLLNEGFWNVKTDLKGMCEISGLPEGFRVYVDHDDLQFAQLPGRHSWKFRFLPTDSGKIQKISLKPSASISGIVRLPDGTPIDGIRVSNLELYHYRQGGASNETRTDKNGKFKLTQLLPSDYDIRVSLTGVMKDNWVAPITTIHALKEGESRKGINIQLGKGVLVTGSVTFGDTGKPLVKAMIGGTAPNSSSPLVQWWSKTDAEGKYQFRLPAGSRKVYYGQQAPKGYAKPIPGEFDFEAKEGDTFVADFVLPRANLFSGTVIGPDGAPAIGAKVVCIKPRGAFGPTEVITDSKGEFTFELPSDTETATLIAMSGNQATKVRMKIDKGKPGTLQLVEEGFATAQGKVIGTDGKPIVGVKITWTSDWFKGIPSKATTDANGMFLAELLLPEFGASFFAEKDGFGSDSQSLDLVRGKTSKVPDLVLPVANKSVTGKVVDAAGNAIPSAWVDVEGYQQPSKHQRRNNFADEDGQFEIKGVVDSWLWIVGGNTAKQKDGRPDKVRVRAGDRDVVLVLTDEEKAWHKAEINLMGKMAPILKAKTWFNSEPLAERHQGAIRLIKFIGMDRSLASFKKTLPALQKLREQYADEKNLEIIIVHGPWPEEEVSEILQEKFPKISIPIALEPDKGGMSDAFGIELWLTVIIDKDGKVVFQDKLNWKIAKAKVAELLKKK